jgi:hypothetical protein
VWALVVMGFFPGLKQKKDSAKKNRRGCQRLFEDSVLFQVRSDLSTAAGA